jgi:hypothetical protein
MNANLIVILLKFYQDLSVRNTFQSNKAQSTISEKILNPEVIK